MTVEVPAARRGEDVAVLRVGQLRVGLPAGAIRKVSQFATADVIVRNGRSLVRVGDRLVRFTPLAELCGEAAGQRQLLIEGVAAGQPIALAVDAIEGQEEVLLRPLTRLSPTGTMLEGVSLLAGGAPIGVLSPLVLAQGEAGTAPRAAAAAGPPAPRGGGGGGGARGARGWPAGGRWGCCGGWSWPRERREGRPGPRQRRARPRRCACCWWTTRW